MTNTEITEAIIRLQPTAQFMLAGEDFENIDWLCNCPKPTLEEIEIEIAKAPEIAMAKNAMRLAVLNRLGITEEEAQLILGGSN